jgi:hypothetical protein
MKRPPKIINVNDWLNRRNEMGRVPLTPGGKVDRVALAEEYAKHLAGKERAAKLDGEARECSECGETRQHFKDDYICYQCREAS